MGVALFEMHPLPAMGVGFQALKAPTHTHGAVLGRAFLGERIRPGAGAGLLLAALITYRMFSALNAAP